MLIFFLIISIIGKLAIVGYCCAVFATDNFDTFIYIKKINRNFIGQQILFYKKNLLLVGASIIIKLNLNTLLYSVINLANIHIHSDTFIIDNMLVKNSYNEQNVYDLDQLNKEIIYPIKHLILKNKKI